MASGRATMAKGIAQTLRERIAGSNYGTGGSMLPPELTLMIEFNVSRHTIREALQQLVIEGIVERFPGRGTIITEHAGNEGRWAVKSLDDLVGEFADKAVVVLRQEFIEATEQPDIARMFRLRRGDKLFFVRQLLESHGGPCAVANLFTREEYGRALMDQPVDKALLRLLEAHCNIRACRTQQIASAIRAEGDIARLLGVDEGAPTLMLRRTYMDREGNPVQYSELLCRPNRYSQEVEFKRDMLAPATSGA